MDNEICELHDGYTPSENEEYMNPQQLEYFRRVLVKWKEDILSNSDAVFRYLQEDTNPGTDFGDRVAIEADVTCELRARNRATKLVKKIDEALARIHNGSYGYCEETGDPIGIKRLLARPVATLSIKAQELHERKEKRLEK